MRCPNQVRLGPFAPNSWVVEQNWYRVPTQDKQEKEVELMVSRDCADATILYVWGLGKIRPEIFTRENGKYKKAFWPGVVRTKY